MKIKITKTNHEFVVDKSAVTVWQSGLLQRILMYAYTSTFPTVPSQQPLQFFKNLILTIEYQLKKTYNKMHK